MHKNVILFSVLETADNDSGIDGNIYGCFNVNMFVKCFDISVTCFLRREQEDLLFVTLLLGAQVVIHFVKEEMCTIFRMFLF